MYGPAAMLDGLVAEVLTFLFFTAVILGGLAAGAGASVSRGRRRPPLLLAGSCFAVAGFLSILSIGIIFVVLSVTCFIAAARAKGPSAIPSSSA
jgi:hypothetical protein